MRYEGLWSGPGTGVPRGKLDTAAVLYIFLGADDRVSTSKVQFAFWMLALAYALLVIAFHDVVHPLGTFDPRYLLLLGFSAGAAVGAKAITVGQIAGGAISKNSLEFKEEDSGHGG